MISRCLLAMVAILLGGFRPTFYKFIDLNSRSPYPFSMPSIHFTSLGCPRNLVDSEVMLGILLRAGYDVAEHLEEADFLIVNTCSFLEAARTEALETIGALFSQKKSGAKVIVAGCMVNSHKEVITSQFPEVHGFLGAGDVEAVLQAVRAEEVPLASAKSYLQLGEVPRLLATPGHYAYLKIAEGCRKACAYCIIPKIKGPLRSKPLEQIVREFRALLQQGVQEVILIAQDLGDWGKDRGKPKGDLAELLRQLLREPGEYWLRLLYLYPDEITDEIVALLASDRRLCRYLDLPIQHINDVLLKAMRRHTTGGEIKSLIRRLRSEVEGIHLRTSLIVGFPGETEAQFQELAAFLEEYPLDHVGIFRYSREEGTPAAVLPDQVPEEVKEERYQRLMAVQERVVEKLHAARRGQQYEVVVEGYHPESDLLMVGRYYGQAPDIDGQIILNDTRHVTAFGERYPVAITGHAGVDLIGRVKRRAKAAAPKVAVSNRLRLVS